MSLIASSRPGFRARGLLRWPGQLLNGSGISWLFANGKATPSIDVPSLVDLPAVADPSKYTTLVYDSVLARNVKLRLDNLAAGIASAVVSDVRTTIGDAAYTVLNSDRYVGLTATLTAGRNITLPLADSVPGGREIQFVDEVGGVSTGFPWTFVPSGANTISGASSSVMAQPFGAIAFRSNGQTGAAGRWTPVKRARGLEPALGSATVPSIFFAGDSNTGIYSPGADQIAITTGGTQALLLDATGAATFRAGATFAGALSGVTSLTMSGALSGLTSLTMNGALSGATSLSMNGALSGVASLNGDALRGFTNKLINGQFDIWQRGTGGACPAATRTFWADRFFINPAGAAVSATQAAGSGSGRSKYCILITGATSVTTVNVGQRIESAEIPAINKPVTFQAWIFNNSGASFTPSLLLGTPAASDDFTTVTNKLTQALQACANGVWTQVSATGVDISAYANVLNGLQVELQIPNGALSTGAKQVYFSDADLHAGSTVVTFERRPIGVELALCERYCEKSYDMATAPGTVTQNGRIGFIGSTAGFFSSGSSASIPVAFKVKKRTSPSVTIYSTFAGTAGKISDQTPADRSASVTAGENAFTVTYTDATAAAGMLLQYLASAEL